MSQREREQHRESQNAARERNEAQRRMQEFNEFKFNVDLEYKDEFGLEMTKKDAFKHLSHTFHGKQSGTMKKGKYLDKVIGKNENVEASTMGDVEKMTVQRERQKKLGSAFTRLQ
jgi:U4/U6.U5 tri-snRNP-associated protein 1